MLLNSYPVSLPGHVCYTGQIAFDDTLSDRIALLEPYRQHDLKRTRLYEDHIFDEHVRNYLMKTTPVSKAKLEQGLTGTITVFVGPTAAPRTRRHGRPAQELGNAAVSSLKCNANG